MIIIRINGFYFVICRKWMKQMVKPWITCQLRRGAYPKQPCSKIVRERKIECETK